jgi:hypothetical protein
MWTSALGIGLLLVLTIAVLPVPRVRRLLLTASARLGQATLLAFLGACGTFFIHPEAAPSWLQITFSPVLEGMNRLTPASLNTLPGLPWLVLAILAVGVGLPLLIVIELAASLAKQSALVGTLGRDLCAAAGWFDRRLSALGFTGPVCPSSRNTAARTALPIGPAVKTTNTSARRVLDLLK